MNFEVVTIDSVSSSFKAQGHTRNGTQVTIINRGPRLLEIAGKNRHTVNVRYALEVRIGRNTYKVMAKTNVLLALKWKIPAHEVRYRLASVVQRHKETLGAQLKMDQSLLARPSAARPVNVDSSTRSEDSKVDPPDPVESGSDHEPEEPSSSSDSSSVNSA